MKKLLTPLFLLGILFLTSCGESEEEPMIDIIVSIDNFIALVDENIEVGTEIGTVSATTNTVGMRYSLSDQNPEGAIVIGATSGTITVADAAAFDFETNEMITAIVTATNGDVSESARVTINIKDVDEGGAAKVLWTGESITFSKEAGADPTDEANQDRITDNVWITRGTEGQIYNIKSESAANKDASPADTEWAIGTIDNVDDLEFKPFRAALGKPKTAVGKDLVMHLITDDIYISVKITAWGEEKVGDFAYERSTM